MKKSARCCVWAFALAAFLSAAALADDTPTFLDKWLQGENVAHVGCTALVNKKTGEKIELVSLNRTPDPKVHGYRNRKTGEIIYSALSVEGGQTTLLKTDGEVVRVNLEDYDEFPANEASDVAGRIKYVILKDYDEVPLPADLKDTIVFIPINGPISSHPAVKTFCDGLAYLADRKPACVVVIVDTPSGAIPLAQEMCHAIHRLRRLGVKCVAYVNGQTRRAASVGVLACLSCEGIYMSPRSQIGPCIRAQSEAAQPDAIKKEIQETVQRSRKR